MGRDYSGLGKRSWKIFRGKKEANLRIVPFYRLVRPTEGGGPGPVYAQEMSHISNLRRKEFLRKYFLSDKAGDIKKLGKQRIPNNLNKYILSKRIRTFTTKLKLWELITDRHESMRPDNTRKNI